jgi:type I restriction enzyme, R subunit
MIDKKSLSERDICTKFITPALVQAGWDLQTQIREEVSFTKGRVIVRGRLVSRGKEKRADYILFYKNNIPLAIIEAKDNHHSVGAGMQQAIEYGEMLQVPFVFSSNGDAFLARDNTVTSGEIERELPLDAFPSPAELWRRYCAGKGLLTRPCLSSCRIITRTAATKRRAIIKSTPSTARWKPLPKAIIEFCW